MDTECVDSSDKGSVVAPCLKPRLDYTILTSKDSSRRTRECASIGGGGGVVAKSCDSYNPTACLAPLSMGFCRQEHWSGLPFPSPGDLPNTGIEPRSPALQADSLPSELRGSCASIIRCQKLHLLLSFSIPRIRDVLI